jgi:hypothetical protein
VTTWLQQGWTGGHLSTPRARVSRKSSLLDQDQNIYAGQRLVDLGSPNRGHPPSPRPPVSTLSTCPPCPPPLSTAGAPPGTAHGRPTQRSRNRSEPVGKCTLTPSHHGDPIVTPTEPHHHSLEPPMHRPQHCPTCNHPSHDIRNARCRKCRWRTEHWGDPRTDLPPPAEPGVMPNICDQCGQPLLLDRPGRTTCERCRLDSVRLPVPEPRQAAPDTRPLPQPN